MSKYKLLIIAFTVSIFITLMVSSLSFLASREYCKSLLSYKDRISKLEFEIEIKSYIIKELKKRISELVAIDKKYNKGIFHRGYMLTE